MIPAWCVETPEEQEAENRGCWTGYFIKTQTLQEESSVDFRNIRLAHRLRPSTSGDSAMLWDTHVVVQANQTKI